MPNNFVMFFRGYIRNALIIVMNLFRYMTYRPRFLPTEMENVEFKIYLE